MHRRRSLAWPWLALLLALVQALSVGAARAQAQPAGLPTQPMLRIEAGGVSALPRAAALDQAAGLLYSAGDDKAVRVWRSDDLRLLQTWYLPSAGGPEGQVNALALSPDGRWLAAGGWTGRSWDGAMSIYVFETATGRMAKRITGISPVIGALQFSPDGEHLAVGLVGRGGGLLLLRWSEAELLFRDAEYQDSVLGIDFSDRSFAAVALDGSLRIYDGLQAPVRRVFRLQDGAMPTRVRFAPDGRSLAISFHDVTAVSVVDAATGSVVWRPSTAGIHGQKNLSLIAWSHDGRRLLAGGDPGGGAVSRLFTWTRDTATPPQATDVARQRLSALVASADGSVFVLAEDPSIARWREHQQLARSANAGALDLRDASHRLAPSADCKRVEGVFDRRTTQGFAFDLAKLQLLPASRAAAGATAPAPPASLRWQAGRPQATLDGRPLELSDHEFVHAASAAGPGLPLLATEYGVRVYEADGRLRWFADVGGVAWSARTCPDRRHVIAASSDGTLRWLRVRDGAPVLTLFIHADSQEWVAWTPDGYYASSPSGDLLIGWQLNRSQRERADFYRASQFERVLFRPDIVRLALADLPAARSGSQAGGFSIDQLANIAPPRVDVTILPPASPSSTRMRARVEATAMQAAMQDLTVFVDDIPVTPAAHRKLASAESRQLAREIEFDPVVRGGTLRVEVRTDYAIGVGEGNVPLRFEPPPPARGSLYLLSIGVRRFGNLPRQSELFFTERDAQEVATFFREQEGRLFDRVHTKVLSDDAPLKPTRQNILDALHFISAASERDTVIVFLASHGMSDAAGNYYFAVADSRLEDLCSILAVQGQPPPPYCTQVSTEVSTAVSAGVSSAKADRSSFIAWQGFFDAIGSTAGRRVMIVDTCEAGGIRGTGDIGSLRKRSASSRFSLMLARGLGGASQGESAGRHGLFTFALLKGMRGAAAAPDGTVTLSQAFDFARAEVARLRDRRLGPMNPVLDSPPMLRGLRLAGARQ